MISDTGTYWSTGITVTWAPIAERVGGEPYPGWHVSLEYSDEGWADNDSERGQVSTRGTLHTRYPVRDSKTRSGLSIAIDTLLTDAKRLGIDFTRPDDQLPMLYHRDSSDGSGRPPPDGWRALIQAEAARIGWMICTG
jgi:hypothetical protein